MILWLLGVALAADPAVFRGPLLANSLAVDGGGPTFSAAYSPEDRMGIGFTWSEGSLGLAAGSSRSLTDPERPWGVEVTYSAGLAVTTARPGAALLLMGSIASGFRGEDGLTTFGIVVPAAVGGPPGGVSAPALLEMRVGRRLGETWIGVRADMGAGFNSFGPPTIRGEFAAWVRLKLPAPGSAKEP